MSARRTLILIVAVALGALAAVGLLNYVRNAETGAGEAGAPVEVWVAKAEVPKGTSIQDALDQGLIGQETVAQSLRPATAVVDPATELAGLVAVFDIQANMPIVTGSFVSSEIVNTGIADRLEETGLITLTVSVTQVDSVAYLVEPGDYVNIWTVRDWEQPFFDNDPPYPVTPEATAELATNLSENDATRPIITDVFTGDARLVYQKAEVLAVGTELVPDIGQNPDEDVVDDQGQVRGLVTFAVPPEAAQVILNVGLENLYLSLVPKDYEPRPITPLDPTTQVLPGEDAERLTPYRGFDNVVDPTELPEGVAFEGEDRIGTPPSPVDGGDGAAGGEPGEESDPDVTPETTVPEETTESTEGGSTEGGGEEGEGGE